MMNATKEEQQRGYRTEFEIAALLNHAGYFVKPIKAKRGARVPLVEVNGELVRAVDLLVRRDGREWRLEVKSLTPRGDSASPTYIISSEQLADYVMQERSWKASSEAGAAADNGGVYVVVKDATATAGRLDAWKFLAPSEIEKCGTPEMRSFDGDPEKKFVRWHRERMRPLSELLPQITGTIASPPVKFETIVLEQSNSRTATRKDGPLHSLVGTLDELGGIAEIQQWVERGIKVACFYEKKDASNCESFVTAMKKKHPHWGDAKLFQEHLITQPAQLLIQDGQPKIGTLKDLKHIGGLATRPFNFEQFSVEHAAKDQHIIVKAGAGSGKTTVMLERLLFLLATDDGLKPANLGLITFTRKATKEMRERLGKLLVARLSVAIEDSRRFREWLVFSNDLSIQTISAYCNGLIARLGKSIGLASGTTLRNLTTRRREELRYALRKEQDRHPSPRPLGRPEYLFLSLAMEFWERIDNLSATLPRTDQEKRVTFDGVFLQSAGNQLDPSSGHKPTADLLFTIIAQAKERMDDWKRREAVLELCDLSAVANSLDLGELFGGDRGLRYLMIDEFQDTDNAQIALVAKMLKTPRNGSEFCLFCVGDTKQAIYRFRGAEYTAFEALEKCLEEAGAQHLGFALSRNYRTDPRLLEQLERDYFTRWKTTPDNWLPKDAALIGGMSPDPSWQDAELLQVKDLGLPPDAPEFLAKTAASILTYLNDKRIQTCEVRNTTTPQGTNFEVVQTETVTILTRTNKQAQEIQSKIEEFAKARNDVRALRWLNDLEDGLFENENAIAARTLLALLRWLASPEDLEATFNLMVTGWTEKFLDWRVAENLLLSENEDERAKLKALLDPIRAELQEAQTRSLSMPIPALLAWAVDRYPIAGRGSELTNPDDASRQRLLGNLRLVMAHLATDSSESQWNIAGCIAWLEMKLATDASSSDKTPAWKPTAGKADKVCRQRPTDDELYREPVQIQAMTAHKAKGLEFRHVVLPCLHQPIFVGSDGLFASTGELRWQFKYEPQEQQEQQEPQLPRKGKILSHTDVEENEKREVLREEARLLYVALTRAKKSVLLIHGTPDAKSHAWVAPFLLPKI